jgi:SDR family mycofactocin-dependent oxidoreductase
MSGKSTGEAASPAGEPAGGAGTPGASRAVSGPAAAAGRKRFAGRIALVTGGARGIGRECALALAREGADLVLLDRCASVPTTLYEGATAEDLARTQEEVQALGRHALTIRADVTREAELGVAVSEALARLGRIDVLVCSAGIFTWGRLWELTEEQWDETIDVNLKGVWLTLKAVVPHMIARRYGRIVVVSSTAGLRGWPGMAHYVASKHGVIGLVRSLALEVGEHGVTVNAVCPTRVPTDMVTYPAYYEHECGPGATLDDLARTTRADQALPVDFVPATAIADGVAWLASDEAAYVTGTALAVDAGELLV